MDLKRLLSWRRSCRWPRSHAQISTPRMTPQKLSLVKTARCLCLNICAAELKPLVGARQGGSTGQAENLSQERSEHMARVKRSFKQARLRREPRVNVPPWATKAACFSSSVTAIIAKTFQPCHRGRRLLHLSRRSWHTDQSDGNDVHSSGQDLPRVGDPDSNLTVLGELVSL